MENSDQIMNTYSLWQKRRAEKNRKNPALYRLLTIPSKKKKKRGGGVGYQKKIQMNKQTHYLEEEKAGKFLPCYVDQQLVELDVVHIKAEMNTVKAARNGELL